MRKVQSYGIQVQAGMIVGFDHDDATIFEEQLRFIQDARIPVSMTGMLQAMPKTPLHDRVAARGPADRRVDRRPVRVLEHPAAQHDAGSSSTAATASWSTKLYDFRNYRARTLAFLLHRGAQVSARPQHPPRRPAPARRASCATPCCARGPRRAWFTLSLLGATLLRRPSVFEDAVSFAIVHKALYEYVHALRGHLDAAIAELEREAAQLREPLPEGGA